jgi:serine protease Do
MDFFNGFSSQTSRKPSILGIAIAAFFGAILGGLLVGIVILNYGDFGQNQVQADNLFPPPIQQENPLRQQDLPEYQNTAIVRSTEKMLPTVVGITNKAMVYDFFRNRQTLQERATGTGVIIDSSGYIVTNNHVVEGAQELTVTLSDGEDYAATIIGTDPNTDLAVIKIEATNLPTAQFGDSDQLRVGEVAIAIGNPLGLAFSQTVTVGVISAKQRVVRINEHDFTFIQTDAAINDGNSGGPLVNIQGEVIGINTAKIKITGVEGMGFAIPASTVKKISRDLIVDGQIIRPWMGVWADDVNDTIVTELQLPVNYGVFIDDVYRGGPADNAGIRRGDVIVAMEGQKINNFTDMRRIILEHRVGDEIEIIIYRDRQQVTIKVVLDKLPELVD